jgi:hypothetical protein
MTPTETTPPTHHGGFDEWFARALDVRQTLLAGLVRKLIDDAMDLLGGLF